MGLWVVMMVVKIEVMRKEKEKEIHMVKKMEKNQMKRSQREECTCRHVSWMQG